jgi:ribosomal protein S18 acetylase RimI-like enzyme
MQHNFKIRKANSNDAIDCARIHQQEIKTGFLSQLGIQFLVMLYKAIVITQYACCFVVEDENGKVTGFITGCFNTSKFYEEFIIKYGLKVILVLFPNLVKPVMLKKIFEIVKYPFMPKDKSKTNDTESELLSIAVEACAKGTGVSQELAHTLFNELKDRKIKNIKVVVSDGNIRANKFYKGLGFKLYSIISIHGSEISNLYIKKL